ncbi:unnamed protein product, partial [Heterotrigona itama]
GRFLRFLKKKTRTILALSITRKETKVTKHLISLGIVRKALDTYQSISKCWLFINFLPLTRSDNLESKIREYKTFNQTKMFSFYSFHNIITINFKITFAINDNFYDSSLPHSS